jgi:hypothetical protein
MSEDSLAPDFDRFVDLLFSPKYCQVARETLLAGGKPAIDALIRGMAHPNPKMRVWCTALLDHMEADWDASCVQAVIERLDDEVPRVRSHALHALSCQTCHPTLPDLDVVAPLLKLATSDPSIRVRRTAVRHLALLPYDPRIVEALSERLAQETDSILRSRITYALNVHGKPGKPRLCIV